MALVAAFLLGVFALAPQPRANATGPPGPPCPASVGEKLLLATDFYTPDDKTWREVSCGYRADKGYNLILRGIWETGNVPLPGTCGDSPFWDYTYAYVSSQRRAQTDIWFDGDVIIGDRTTHASEVIAAARSLLSALEQMASPCSRPLATAAATATRAAPGVTPTAPPSATVARASTTTPTLVATATATAKAGLPLCPEATSLLDGFGADRLRAGGITDPSKTGIIRGKDSLLADFQLAIKNHNLRFPDDKAYVTSGAPVLGELGALNWLFSSDPAIGGPVAKAYVTGTEPKLVGAIKNLSNQRKAGGGSPLLTPGDVLELAIDLNGGNVNQAVLTAHNTLRALGRGDGTGLIGVTTSGDFFDSYLVKLRDGNENVGPWYHLFGTTYLELVAKGDWGPWLATGGVMAAGAAGILPGGPVLFGVLASELARRLPSQTVLSRIANDAEQLYRENVANDKGQYNSPDPEKYCFNVWGAQIGKLLYESLPSKSTRALRDFFSRFSVPNGPSPVVDPVSRVGKGRFINIMGSPFSVQWNDGTMRMVVDQGSDPAQATLSGGVPMLLLPVLEGDSWSLVWLSPDNSGQTVTFEAVNAGAELHYLRVDTQSGQAALYQATAAQAGERFEVNVDPVTVAPPLRRGDKSEVIPQIVTLDLSGDPPRSGVETTGSPGGSSILLLLILVAGIGTAVGAGAWKLAGQLGEAKEQAGLTTAPVADAAPESAGQTCAVCGASGAPGMNFCMACGTPLQHDVAAAPSCPVCGHDLLAEARFCYGCGAPTSGAA